MKKIITDDPNYNRDPISKALINVNQHAFEEYRLKRSMQNRINKLEENIIDLNAKVDNILNILTKLAGN